MKELDDMLRTNLAAYQTLTKADFSAALRHALRDCLKRGYGRLVVNPGTYTIDRRYADNFTPFEIPDNFILEGRGNPLIQVTKKTGIFDQLFFTQNAVRKNIIIRGITFDLNTATSTAPPTPQLPQFIFGLNASGVLFEDCTFNYHGYNAVVSTAGNDGLYFNRCIFNYTVNPAIALNAQGVKYIDNSGVYSNSVNTHAQFCQFNSSAISNYGIGGFEFHAPHGSLRRCTSLNMATLCHIAPNVGTTADTDVTVDNCAATACCNGVLLWPTALLSKVRIARNSFDVQQVQWQLASYCGIGLGAGSSQTFDVWVEKNYVSCVPETTRPGVSPIDGQALQQYACGGINFGFNSAADRYYITDNQLMFCPLHAIRAGGEGAVIAMNDWEIRRNTIQNSGRFTAAQNDWKSFIHTRATMANCMVTDNKFWEVSGVQQGMYWIHNDPAGTYTNCKHGRNEKIQPGGYTIADSLAAGWGAAA